MKLEKDLIILLKMTLQRNNNLIWKLRKVIFKNDNNLKGSIPFCNSLLLDEQLSNENSIVSILINHTEVSLIYIDYNEIKLNFDFEFWYNNLINENYREEHVKPISAKLPFHYHYIPAKIRNFIASKIITDEIKKYPSNLLDFSVQRIINIIGKKYSEAPLLVLTHDIDSAKGFNYIEDIISIEEKYKLKSSWNVVPDLYKIDHKILSNLFNNGFEIGLHGLRHDNNEAFMSYKKFKYNLDLHSGFINKYEIKGYRGPSWYRTKSLMKVLSENFQYDLSCLDNDVICPGGKGGVGTMNPFKFENGLIELPCTIPFETPILLNMVNQEDIVEYWKNKVNFIIQNNCMLLINTHPDPNYLGNKKMLDLYDEFLSFVSSYNWNHKLPSEILVK